MSFLSKVELKRKLQDLGVRVEGKYSVKDEFDQLLKKIENLIYTKVTGKVWSMIQNEGLDEEFEADRNDFSYSKLTISDEMKQGFIKFDERYINAGNMFDIALKKKYGKKYTDFIDYDAGEILIIRLDADVHMEY